MFMAGWSMLSNGSGLDCVENKCQSKSRFEIDNSVKDGVDGCDDYEDKKKYLFYRTRSVFLKEVASRNSGRPIPPMLGDGHSADLFKLFWAVRERGGFDSVSKKGMWASVTEELGLDAGITSSVKLIYIKYLIELDQWFQKQLRNGSVGNGQSECGLNSAYSLEELEAESTGGLWGAKNVDTIRFNCEKSFNDNANVCRDDAKKVCDDDAEIFYDNHDHYHNNVVVSELSVAKKEIISLKRKRDSSLEMLKWVIEVAKHPFDPAIGTIPEGSNWKEYENKELRAQVIWAREVLFLPRHVDSNADQSPLQNKLRMHPSMYEDPNVSIDQSTERLRCSKRLPSLTKAQLCPCCKPCLPTETKLASARTPDLENIPKEETVVTTDLLEANTTGGSPQDNPLEKCIRVGPLYQSLVPEWTGMVFHSDPKWVGTRVWPVENGKGNSHIELDSIGKGRKDSCNCRLPGSVGCVRFHISEKRITLKLELGPAFYHWRFHCIGEEVSLRWTFEEEKRFKDMVRFNRPSLDKCFWDTAFKYFPRKKREKLVSYYFNVFIVQRRSYQNRVTPKTIDSDDDESEFGSFSESFGQEAVKVPGSNLLICTQNKEYTQLEYLKNADLD